MQQDSERRIAQNWQFCAARPQRTRHWQAPQSRRPYRALQHVNDWAVVRAQAADMTRQRAIRVTDRSQDLAGAAHGKPAEFTSNTDRC